MHPHFPQEIQQVQLIYGSVSEILERDLSAILSDSDHLDALKHLNTNDQKRHLAGKALSRMVLSELAQSEPSSILFEVSTFGKPYIASHPEIKYNLSHSEDKIVIAVSTGIDVGVDIEFKCREVNIEQLSPYLFHPGELIAFSKLSTEDQKDHFLKTWSAKEAILKCSGEGLTQNMNSFTIEEHMDPGNSSLHQRIIDNAYYLSVAVNSPNSNIQLIPLSSFKLIDISQHVLHH